MIETGQFQELWDKRVRLEIWYSFVSSSALMAVAQIAVIEIDRYILGRPFLVLRLPYLFVGLACLIVLVRRREEIAVKTMQRAMVALTLAAFLEIWISQAAYANSGHPWIPFYGFQMSALVVASLRYGNGVRSNVFLLAAIMIEAAVFWSLFHLGSDPLVAQSGHIWNILLTGLGAVILLIARYKYERTIRRYVQLEARAATAEMTARVFLGVRDWANSPLQTLEIGLALLKRQQPENAITDALRRALKRLVELHEIFKTPEAEIDWSQAQTLTDLNWFKKNRAN